MNQKDINKLKLAAKSMAEVMASVMPKVMENIKNIDPEKITDLEMKGLHEVAKTNIDDKIRELNREIDSIKDMIK